MLFSEPTFLFLFLPVALLLHFALRGRARNLLLLLASLVFYAAGEGAYLAVILISIAFNYLIGLWLDLAQRKGGGRLPLIVGMAGNLWILGLYKYANFIVLNLNRLLAVFSLEPWPVPDIHLPIGISFFTFQAMSYLIDAARRNVAVQCNPLDFGLYIALFPQLVAGPIVRYRDVAAQIVRRMVTRDGLAYGIQRFIVGLAKKLVLADTLALRADGVFALRGDYLTTPAAWFGLACYTLQIYFDFSGYSDMAIGLGRMLGFKFRENFAYPYIARSITEFWRRWHISLSTWFRDYLYIPLGGNRRRPWIVGRNLITVFFLCGLWHGASWNFVLWGLYHGAFLLVERLARNRVPWAAPRFLQHAYALLVVMFGWVLFRADSLPHAGEFLAALCGLARGAGPAFEPALFLDPEIALVAAAGALGAAPCLPWLAARFRGLRRRLTGPARLLAEAAASAAAGLALGLLLLYAAMLMAAGTYSPFIYYRF